MHIIECAHQIFDGRSQYRTIGFGAVAVRYLCCVGGVCAAYSTYSYLIARLAASRRPRRNYE